VYDGVDTVFDNVSVEIVYTPLNISWQGYTELNNSYHSDNITMQYEIFAGEKNITCDFYIDGNLNDSNTYSSDGVKSFTYEVDNSTVSKKYQMRVNCSNIYESVDLGVKNIYIDIINPTTNIYQPAQNSSHYIGNGLPVDVVFENLELDETRVLLYDSLNNVKFNDTETGIVGNYSAENYTINSTDLELGDMSVQFWVFDEVGHNVSNIRNMKIFNCTEKQENWTVQYTVCDTLDNQTMYYIDENDCGTTYDLPVNNGTVVSCNYCTVEYSSNLTECYSNEQTRYYYLINNATCCALTNITDDCTVPVNETVIGCSGFGLHQAGDIPSVVIDAVSEYGIAMIELAGLIATISLVILI
jgi:hypothetical protein